MSNQVDIEFTQNRRSTVAEELGLSREGREVLDSALVVFLPSRGKGSHELPVFASGTRELFQYVFRNAPENIPVDVASSDNQYRELAEHADLLVLPTLFLAEPVALPVLLGVISNYLYDKARTLLPGRTMEVQSEVLIQSGDGMVSIKYKGPPDAYRDVVCEAFRNQNGA